MRRDCIFSGGSVTWIANRCAKWLPFASQSSALLRDLQCITSNKQICYFQEYPHFKASTTKCRLSFNSVQKNIPWIYFRDQKKGALSGGATFIFFIATTVQVVIRLIAFQVWAFHLGFGMLKYAFLGVFIHIFIMASLHFVFSDSKRQILSAWSNGSFQGYFYDLCYINWKSAV